MAGSVAWGRSETPSALVLPWLFYHEVLVLVLL